MSAAEIEYQPSIDQDDIDRRQSARDIAYIAQSIHHIDRRVAVLETRVNGQDSRLARIEDDVATTRRVSEKIHDSLSSHTQQEDRDRQKIMWWLITTLVSVIGFGATIVAKILIGY